MGEVTHSDIVNVYERVHGEIAELHKRLDLMAQSDAARRESDAAAHASIEGHLSEITRLVTSVTDIKRILNGNGRAGVVANTIQNTEAIGQLTALLTEKITPRLDVAHTRTMIIWRALWVLVPSLITALIVGA